MHCPLLWDLDRGTMSRTAYELTARGQAAVNFLSLLLLLIVVNSANGALGMRMPAWARITLTAVGWASVQRVVHMRRGPEFPPHLALERNTAPSTTLDGILSQDMDMKATVKHIGVASLDRLCLQISNLLSTAECARVIERCEAEGFVPVPDIYDDDYRVHVRCECVNMSFAEALSRRLACCLPPQVEDAEGRWTYAGISSHLRVYRYDTGGIFQPHRDSTKLIGSRLRTR